MLIDNKRINEMADSKMQKDQTFLTTTSNYQLIQQSENTPIQFNDKYQDQRHSSDAIQLKKLKQNKDLHTNLTISETLLSNPKLVSYLQSFFK